MNAVCQHNVKMSEIFVTIENFVRKQTKKCHQILQWRKPFRGQLFLSAGSTKI